MALPRVSSDSSWSGEILEAAREFFNGTLTITKPGTPGQLQPDGTRGPSTPGETVIAPRPARAQHLASPTETNDGNGWDTRRRYRFQCEILPGDKAITKGLVVTFDGGRDPELEKMTFQVLWATNSSHAAVRTIEAITEGARA